MVTAKNTLLKSNRCTVEPRVGERRGGRRFVTAWGKEEEDAGSSQRRREIDTASEDRLT